VQVGRPRRHAGHGRCAQKSLLDEEWLGHVFQRATLLAERGRQAVDADRSAVETLDDRRQQFAIQGVKTQAVHLEQIQRGVRHGLVNAAVGPDLRIVAHAPQQTVGDARRAARALRDAARAAVIDRNPENAGRTLDDALKIRDLVKLEPVCTMPKRSRSGEGEGAPRGSSPPPA